MSGWDDLPEETPLYEESWEQEEREEREREEESERAEKENDKATLSMVEGYRAMQKMARENYWFLLDRPDAASRWVRIMKEIDG